MTAPQQIEEEVAKRRLLLMTLSGLSGVLLMLLGILVWRTDLLREGGWIEVGLIILVAGFVEAMLVPRLLAARWRSPRGE